MGEQLRLRQIGGQVEKTGNIHNYCISIVGRVCYDESNRKSLQFIHT